VQRFVKRGGNPKPVQIEPLQPLWIPQPDWAGKTAVVIGTGPSFDVAQARQIGLARSRGSIRVLAVNDAAFPAWYADLVFAADRKWWIARDNLPNFEGIKVSLSASYWDAPKGVRLIARAGTDGCELRPGSVYTHGHSGAMAVQLAAQMGAAKIVLVGFDMRPSGQGQAERHFFGGYEDPLGSKPNMAKWVKDFRAIADAMPGRILNATPGSALDCVPQIDLSAAIAH